LRASRLSVIFSELSSMPLYAVLSVLLSSASVLWPGGAFAEPAAGEKGENAVVRQEYDPEIDKFVTVKENPQEAAEGAATAPDEEALSRLAVPEEEKAAAPAEAAPAVVPEDETSDALETLAAEAADAPDASDRGEAKRAAVERQKQEPSPSAASPPPRADAPADGGPTQEEIFAEVKENPLFREIAEKYGSSFTDKQLFEILGTCVMLPKHLEHCVTFSCRQRETPDLRSFRLREVIGSYDGSCYYREVSERDKKRVECELSAERQKALASQIAVDVKRLVKTDVLVEDAVRAEAKSIYDSCLERADEGGTSTLLASKKQRAEEIARIRQSYKDKLDGVVTEADRIQAVEAIRQFQNKETKRLRLRQDLLEEIEKRAVPTTDSVRADLWSMFPEPRSDKAEQAVEDEKRRRQELAEYLQKLEASEASLPPSLRMPAGLKEAMGRVSDKRIAADEKARTVSPILLKYGASPSALPEIDPEGKDMAAEDAAASAETLTEGDIVGDADSAPAPAFVLTVRKIGGGVDGPGKRRLQDRLYEAFDALVQGQYPVAVALYKELNGQYPDNPDVLFGLASAYHKLGQGKQARPYYEQAIRLAPDRDDLLNNFLALLAEEAPENALIELRKLEMVSPGFSPVPAQIGLIYFGMGDYVSAVTALKRAVSMEDANPHYLYNLAVALDKGALPAEAAYYYRRYLSASIGAAPVPGVSRDGVQARVAHLELNR
jgi:Tfp pilus assembly protein PilF